jgi:hypothetical protein
MGFATTFRGTMRFFRKKDKRKNGGDSGQSWTPGFGDSTNNGKHPAPGHGGYGGYGLGDPRPDSDRSFGSPPSGGYDPRNNLQGNHSQLRPTRASAAALAQLPAPILERIFAFVCPQSQDESYGTCEQSSVEDACMLCDLRDLAHCVAVSRRWKPEAVKLLYVEAQSCLELRLRPRDQLADQPVLLQIPQYSYRQCSLLRTRSHSR